VYIMTFISFLSLLFGYIVFKHQLKISLSTKLLSTSLIKNFAIFSAMAYIGNVFQFLSYKIDFWFVDAYCGKEQLGIYSLAAQLSQLLWIIPQSLSSVLYTYASKMNVTEALEYALKFKKMAFYATVVLAILGIAISYFFIPILFGEAFKESFYILVIFLVGIVPFSVPIIIASFLGAFGNFKISFYISLFVSILSIFLYYILIPRFGIFGGAIASVTSYVISFLLVEIYMVRYYKVAFLESYFISKADANHLLLQVKKIIT
jgi:O-antigen/teichoic acid export membrane protein